MGLAEVLPGISGGTVAYVTKIYPRLVEAIAVCTPQTMKWSEVRHMLGRVRSELPFLIPVAIGMVLGLLVMLLVVAIALDTNSIEVWGMIFGLMAGAVVFLWFDTSISKLIVWGIPGLIVGLMVSYLSTHTFDTQSPSLPLIFVGGFLAFAAWILPGVSGSMMLLILGVWEYMVESFVSLAWLPILVFLSGLGLGVVVIPRFIHEWLNHKKTNIVAVFCGLLLGSLVRVWPWRSDSHLPVMPSFDSEVNNVAIVATLMFCGFLVIMTLKFYGRQKQKDL